MRTNFKIVSFTEIEFDGIVFDLHNNFEFIAEDIEKTKKRITLHFKKTNGEWAKEVNCQEIYFSFDNYNFIKEISPVIEFITDDFCLSGITYFSSNFREENYGLTERKYPNEDDDIIFSFESERVIRINCETVTLKII